MTHLALGLALAAHTVGSIPLIPATGELSKADLVSLQKLHQRRSTGADQFTVDPVADYAGRRFRLVIAPEVEYVAGSQTLFLKTDRSYSMNLEDHTLRTRTSVMANSFGVRARVTDRYVLIYGVDFEKWNAQTPVLSDDHSLKRFHVEVKAEPSAARKLSQETDVVLTGEVVKGSDGEVVHCGLGSSGPATLTSPTSTFGVACGVRVVVDEVVFRNRNTGEVLGSFSSLTGD